MYFQIKKVNLERNEPYRQRSMVHLAMIAILPQACVFAGLVFEAGKKTLSSVFTFAFLAS